jgi:hypothetical protein
MVKLVQGLPVDEGFELDLDAEGGRSPDLAKS